MKLPISKSVHSSLYDSWDKELIEEIKREILADRDAKISSIIDDVPFEEKKLEDDERYKKAIYFEVKPLSAPIFYLDYKFTNK